MKRWLWIGVPLLAVVLSPALRGAEDVKSEIIKLGKVYDHALLAGDAKTLDRLYHDEAVFIDDKGRKYDKKGYLPLNVKPGMKWEVAEGVPDSIQVFGDTAIETGLFTGKGKDGNQPFQMRMRYTDVWVRKNGSWVVVLEQGTPLPEK